MPKLREPREPYFPIFSHIPVKVRTVLLWMGCLFFAVCAGFAVTPTFWQGWTTLVGACLLAIATCPSFHQALPPRYRLWVPMSMATLGVILA